MNKSSKKRPKNSAVSHQIIFVGTVMLLLLLVVFFYVFSTFVHKYQSNIELESADHLTEISAQIRLYIEKEIENDWKTLDSVALGIRRGMTQDDVGFAVMKQQQEIWGLSNLLYFAENGDSFSSTGKVVHNDKAGDIVYLARKHGRYMTIQQSAITYVVPVETELTLNGSKIVAVSTVKELGSFLDEMDFSSFNGEAYMYLTQANGAVLSLLTHKSVLQTYNVTTLFESYSLESLNDGGGSGVDSVFKSENTSVYILDNKEKTLYMVSLPVDRDGLDLRLFYFVPEDIVNSTMNSFSTYVTALSIAIITLVAVILMVVFFLLYRGRRRAFDSELLSRERMFDLLTNETDNAFALFSTSQSQPLYCSSNAKRLIGFSSIRLERLEKGFRFVTEEGEAPEGYFEINKELADWSGKSRIVCSTMPRIENGRTHHVEIHLYPVEGYNDEFVGIAQDVTAAREREEALKSSIEMAITANEAKTRFLSNMSHDIRTPMNAILNMTDFAIATLNDSEKVAEYLETIKESSEHLLHLINDVLDVSRIESGQTVISADLFNLQGSIEDVCDIITPLSSQKNITLTKDCSQVKNNMLIGDRLKLSQILINVLNNAVKFTHEDGTVVFTVKELPALRSTYTILQCVIEDNGTGMSKETMETIFEPFTRGDSKRVSKIEGTGLGLAICRSYCNAMNGSIVCESEEGKGSKFTIEIPLRIANEVNDLAPVAAASEHVSFVGMRALLCEDNEINQVIAIKVLQSEGFEVDVAGDGKQGLDMFEASAEGTYDVIYMDIQMPVMNGYQSTKAIRSCSHVQASTIPIIAMTANVFAEDVERSRAAGMNGHVGKPIDRNALVTETVKALAATEN